ncbi:MAG: DUF1501 domain-containing protein [Planctomycetaceae bacterium]
MTHSHRKSVSRRTLLRVGGLGFAGLTLSGLLRAEGEHGGTGRSIINIHLDGGPPQLDTIDPKPFAPAELRGEFSPIDTALSGVKISELMPLIARRADAFAFIRTLVGSVGQHDAFQCQSGYSAKDLQSFGGRPAIGSVLSSLLGSPSDAAPTFVDLMQGRPLVRNSARPGFLGPSHQPFRPDLSSMFERELEAGMKGELARLGSDHQLSLELDERLTLTRLDDRRNLLAGLDRIRRGVDHSGMMQAMDQFQEQATGILTSGRLAAALDLSQEDPSIQAHYMAPTPSGGTQSTTSEGPNFPLKFLLARRLIQAGVRMVSVSVSDFDTHSDNFSRMRHLMPMVDHGLHALVTDLEQQGMLNDVVIVVWGEFGRSPRVNANGGRDHWPAVGPCLLAGGGLKTGQVIGETDRTAAAAVSRPVHYKDVFATLYERLGLDARQLTLIDPQGRPQYLLDAGDVISEVI